MAKEKKVKEIEEVVDEYEELSLEDRVMNIEKKVNWTFGLSVIITIISVLLLIFVLADGTEKSTDKNTDNSGTPSEVASDYDVSAFKEIKAQDIKKESKGKNILIYVGRSSCGYCVQYVPILKQVQEKINKYKTYYIDIAKILDFESATGGILDKEANEIMQQLDKEFMESNWGATPLTLVVKDSKLVDSLVGYVDADTLEKLVKNNGFAK